MDGRVYIIILNWNNWQDTVACLESIFQLDYPDFRVVVCDNASTDGSLERMKAWAEGSAHGEPAPRKPEGFIEYDRATAESGGTPLKTGETSAPSLVFIQTGHNLGYAGGNNVGLRYALAQGDMAFAWILNNDTLVCPDTLTHLVRRMREKPRAGMRGSTLLYHHEPFKVQTLGGWKYRKWLGTTHPISESLDIRHAPPAAEPVETAMSYVSGASMLVRREFHETVGLMNEEYFLYYEEIDWVTRAKNRFELAYAPQSIVYHKEGGTTGVETTTRVKSLTADYYGLRNRVKFTRTYYPLCLPTVYLGLLVTLFNRIRRGQWSRIGMVVKLWSPSAC